MALTKDRNTNRKQGGWNSDPVAAGVQIFAGSLVAINAAGYAVPASATATLKIRGVAQAAADNRGGANGAVQIDSVRGEAFQLANFSGEINRTHIGSPCYAVDDETVSIADGGATRPKAGTVLDVEGGQVWVLIA